jgi:hypothetical protein
MARFFVAAMATLAVLACSPGASENDKCNATPDCQAKMSCIFTPKVCKFTCTGDTDCTNGETCQCNQQLRHCDKAPPDGGSTDAGCGG